VRGLARRLADGGLGLPDARQQAYARVYRTVLQQAQTLAYIDIYWVLAAADVMLFCLSFLLRRNDPGGGGGAAVG
jgi:DHA2 family multidrug resistance protein